jgi:uncharacterized protein (DUF427 family)
MSQQQFDVIGIEASPAGGARRAAGRAARRGRRRVRVGDTVFEARRAVVNPNRLRRVTAIKTNETTGGFMSTTSRSITSRRISRILGARLPLPPYGEMQATWHGVVLARSARTVVIEGNRYFPPEDVNFDYLQTSAKQSTCPWKGVASYYDVSVDGVRNGDAAWHYAEPSDAAAEIKDYVAFWNGVNVEPPL